MATLKRHHRLSKCESTSRSYFSWNKLKKYSKILILTYAYCLDVVLKHFSPCFGSVLVRHLLNSLLLIGVSHCFRTALPLHMWKFSLYLRWVGLKGSPVCPSVDSQAGRVRWTPERRWDWMLPRTAAPPVTEGTSPAAARRPDAARPAAWAPRRPAALRSTSRCQSRVKRKLSWLSYIPKFPQ